MASEIVNIQQSRDNNFRDVAIIIFVFFIIYSILHFLEDPSRLVMSNYTSLTYGPAHIQVKSEYTIREQLSKFYLFIIILVSAFSYRVSTHPSMIKLSISFLALSFVMYMSESNIIIEKAQPIFGLLGIAFTGFFLFRLRSRLSLSAFVVGFALVSFGSLVDILHENEFIKSIFPGTVSDLLHIMSEEWYEVSGIAFICLAAILSFRSPLLDFIENETKASMLILISSGIMTLGNGFLHYQYKPTEALFSIALALTLIGFSGLVYSTRSIEYSFPKTNAITRKSIYLCVFFFFVLLPATHGTARFSAALLLWLPSIIFVATYLWRCHLIHHSRAN